MWHNKNFMHEAVKKLILKIELEQELTLCKSFPHVPHLLWSRISLERVLPHVLTHSAMLNNVTERKLLMKERNCFAESLLESKNKKCSTAWGGHSDSMSRTNHNLISSMIKGKFKDVRSRLNDLCCHSVVCNLFSRLSKKKKLNLLQFNLIPNSMIAKKHLGCLQSAA